MNTPAPPGPTPADLLADPLLHAVPVLHGHKVLDQIVLLTRIGGGGMGIVYRGWHVKFRLDVAVKVLKPALAADAEYVQKFVREAQISMGITHQNVVRVVDVRCDHGLHYIAMEFIDGETVTARIARWGKMRQREAVTMLVGVASGLAEAHGRGIVHRDIKPENLLIARTGRVKLADLGLARLTKSSFAMTVDDESSRLMGTPQYMPPEQWTSANVRPPADVWALGATFHYLVTGEHAVPPGKPLVVGQWIQDHDLPALRDKLPGLRDELHAIFERCVQRAEAARFQSAKELLAALLPLQLHDEALLREEELAVRSDPAPVPPIDVHRLAQISEALSTPVVRQVRRPGPRREGTPRWPRRMQWALASGLAVLLAAIFAFNRPPRQEPLADAAPPVATTDSSPSPQPAPAALAAATAPPPPPAVVTTALGKVGILSPVADAVVGREAILAIEVRGARDVIVSDGTTSTAAARAGDAQWRWQGTVREGRVELKVVATGAAGDRAEAALRVVSDQTAPSLAVTELLPFTNQDEAVVAGTAEGTSTLTVDGQPVSRSGEPFRLTVPLPRDGEFTFRIVAKDAAGNATERTLTTRRHTVPPAITWLGPDTKGEQRGDVGVRAGVSSDVGVQEVTINGRAASGRDGQWTANVPTGDGRETEVRVAAIDRAGNTNQLVQVLNGRGDRLAGYDRDFAAAVVRGDRAGLARVADRMAALYPDDPSHRLLQAMTRASIGEGQNVIAGQKAAREFRDAMRARDKDDSLPFGREHVLSRLRRLGAGDAGSPESIAAAILEKPDTPFLFYPDHAELGFRMPRRARELADLDEQIRNVKAEIAEAEKKEADYKRRARSGGVEGEKAAGALTSVRTMLTRLRTRLSNIEDTRARKDKELTDYRQALDRMKSFELK